MTNNQWKQYSLRQEIPTNLSFVWRIFKLWLKRKPYIVTISFSAKHNSETRFTGAQIEY